jgi:hypothetical protein
MKSDYSQVLHGIIGSTGVSQFARGSFWVPMETFCLATRISVTLEGDLERRDSTLPLYRPRRIWWLAFFTVVVNSLFGQMPRTSAKPEVTADPIKPLSVCEVLERRAELMGRFEILSGEYKTMPVERIISVRGEVKFGPTGRT